METPAILKMSKDYVVFKVPIPKGLRFAVGPVRRNGRLTKDEQWLWKIIRQGEREYREGKTIAARSTDEAMKQYERARKKR